MTAKEFLNQSHNLDLRIKSRIEQIERLNERAEKCTAVLSGMPHCPDSSRSIMEEVATRILDLQKKNTDELNRLTIVEEQISEVITSIEDPDLRLLLEKRYIREETWAQIAKSMYYDKRWIQRLHEKALIQVGEKLKYRFPQYLNQTETWWNVSACESNYPLYGQIHQKP